MDYLFKKRRRQLSVRYMRVVDYDDRDHGT